MKNNLINYKEWLKVNGKSTSTIINYFSRIKRFLKDTKGEITKKTIDTFLLDLQANSKPETINGYRKAIKSFLTFQGKKIELPKYLKTDRKIPNTIDEKYFIETIIPTIEYECKDSLRMKTIFYILFYTGIRISELTTLKRKDFDFEKEEIKIYEAKNRQERLVAIHPKIKTLLQQYFLSEAETINAFNIKTKTLKKRFERLKIHFKEINLYPHLLRHSFATRLRSKEFKSEDIQKYMGHKSLQSTMRYAHTDINRLKKLLKEKDK